MPFVDRAPHPSHTVGRSRSAPVAPLHTTGGTRPVPLCRRLSHVSLLTALPRHPSKCRGSLQCPTQALPMSTTAVSRRVASPQPCRSAASGRRASRACRTERVCSIAGAREWLLDEHRPIRPRDAQGGSTAKHRGEGRCGHRNAGGSQLSSHSGRASSGTSRSGTQVAASVEPSPSGRRGWSATSTL